MKKLLNNFKILKLEYVQIAIITFLSSALFSFQLSKESLWLDEIYTYLASNTFDNLVSTLTLKERNMWLYHISMYFWKFWGPGEFVMRSLSVVFAVIGVIFIYKLGKEVGGKRLGIIASLLLMLNVFYIKYAQEARAYSLFACLFIISSYYLIRVLRNDNIKNKFLYVIFTGLSIYSQVFALQFIGLQYLFVFWFFKSPVKRLISFFQISFGISAVILPLFVAFYFASLAKSGAEAVNVLGWISKPTWIALYQQYFIYSSNSLVLLILYITLILFGFLQIFVFHKNNLIKKEYAYFFMMAFVPVIITIGFSIYVKPFFVARYLIFTLPAFLFLAALCLNQIKSKFVLYGIIASVIILSVKNLIPFYFTYQKEQWRQSIRHIYQNKGKNEKVIIFPYYLRLPYDYYATQYSQYNRSSTLIAFPKDVRLDNKVQLNMLDKEIFNTEGIWVITRKDNGLTERIEQKKLLDKELYMKFKKEPKVYDFTLLRVEHYKR